MKKTFAKRFGALALAFMLAFVIGIELTPAGFNNMVINKVAKADIGKK